MTWAIKMANARYDGYDEGYEKGISVGLTTGREEGISSGLEQGLERGAYQKALETAKKFLAYGDSPEKVALCIDLPLETVLELAQTKQSCTNSLAPRKGAENKGDSRVH